LPFDLPPSGLSWARTLLRKEEIMASIRQLLARFPFRRLLEPHGPEEVPARLTPFDGYPYLLTHVVAGLAHVTPLPASLPADLLVALARQQRDANRLPLWLLLDAHRSVAFEPSGESSLEPSVPWRGYLITGRLRLAVPLTESPELVARQERLAAGIAARHATGYLVCDGAAGLPRASAADQATLAGRMANGIPKGLAQCPSCHEWRGTALLRSQDRLVRAYCRCENWNRCARCGAPLGPRRLNAHYYDPADDAFPHLPGFSGLRHVCADQG